MARKNKYLTRRQKLNRIARTHIQLSAKSKEKLLRLRREDTFNRRLKQVVGGVKGAVRRKQYSKPQGVVILTRLQKQLNKALQADPKNKALQKQLLAVTKQINRIHERQTTPQEREVMEFRHQKQEAEMASSIAHGEKLYETSSPLLPKELIEQEFSTKFNEWRETKDAENYSDLEKQIGRDKKKSKEEVQEEAQNKFEPMTDDQAYELFFKEVVLHDDNVKISERNGMYLYKIGEDYQVFYQRQNYES